VDWIVEGDRFMDLDIRPDDSQESSDFHLSEHIMHGLVRLGSLPLFFLVILITSLIYGIAILARIISMFVGLGFGLAGVEVGMGSRPVKAHDA